jgi:hypothetical protein
MRKGYIYVDDSVFPTYFAISQQEQQQGLMNVEWPPPVMSFVYPSPQNNKFWMKNTPSPLDIVFCKAGKIIAIHKGEPYSTSAIGPNDTSDLVIEFPHGTINSSGIMIGNKVGIISPTSGELRTILSQHKF